MADIFRKLSRFSVVGSARYGQDTFAAISASGCDVLLIDEASVSNLPNNFIGDALRRSGERRAVLFGMDDDPEMFLRAVRSGVSGYLLGEASADDMIIAVDKVTLGEAVCPPHLCHYLIQFVARAAYEGSMILNRRLCGELGLTARQQQLVALLARGFTNKEIAGSLCISEFTVKNHVHRIMRRLNAESRYAAVQTVCDRNPSYAP